MKHRLKLFLQRLFNPMAIKLGFVLPSLAQDETSKNKLIHRFNGLIKDTGFAPSLIFDIGANRGTWSKEFIPVFPETHFVLFEPQKWLFDENVIDAKERVRTTFEALAVAGESGKMTFTLNGERDDSSSLSISKVMAIEKNWKQIEVDVVTIDSYILAKNLSVPELIKIDAEGNDLEVLHGAENCFGKTEVFLVEAAVVSPSFKNTVLNVVQLMNEKGYSLFEITDLNRPFKKQVLWLVELCFVKKNGIIDNHYKNRDNLN